METTTVSFPGIGIGEFTMNKVAASFKLFGIQFEIRWYAVLITIGIILALGYAYRRAKTEGISGDNLLDMGIFAIPAGVIGARLYYVLTYGDGISEFVVRNAEGKIKLWDTFVSIIAIWNGGIAIYGAVIGGALAIILVCRHKKIHWLKGLDVAAPAVMIGQILGRWGNFVNGEAYGEVVKESSLLYFLRMGLLKGSKMIYVHPTFLYESMWNLAGFLLINWLYKKKKFDGQVFLMYVTWYGFGRMFIEGLRTDSLYIGVFRVSQVLGFICFIVGAGLLIYGFVIARRKAWEGADYEPVYKNFAKRVLPTKKEDEKAVDNAQSADSINETDAADSAAKQNSTQTTDTENTESEDAQNGENN